VVIDGDSVRLIFGAHGGAKPVIPPNDTPQTARNLGTIVRLTQPSLTIVPGHEDAWYRLTVPIEAAPGSRAEVVDFAALFEHTAGAGLDMAVLDSAGAILGVGSHLRLAAAQGQTLMLHVFGQTASDGSRGTGAYTLDIAILPQLIGVQGEPLLPGSHGRAGGATASLVLSFQGDRLDPLAAQDPANYTVTWLGPDRVAGTADDRTITVGAAGDAQPVVYNPSANIDVVSGVTYPTAVRQTVTLLFESALPAGSYRVEVSPKVGAVSFTASDSPSHPLVTLAPSGITEGADLIVRNAVAVPRGQINFTTFKAGTPFLSQLQADMSALLDQEITVGDESNATPELLAQLQVRLQAGLASATDRVTLLALFLDPTGLDLADPAGDHLRYSLDSGQFANGIPNAFVGVASHVELVVIPFAAGEYPLNVTDVPTAARGGAVVLGAEQDQSISFTSELREGTRTFLIDAGVPSDPQPVQQPATPAQQPATPAQQPVTPVGNVTEFATIRSNNDLGPWSTRSAASTPAQAATGVAKRVTPRGSISYGDGIIRFLRAIQSLLKKAKTFIRKILAARFGMLENARAGSEEKPQAITAHDGRPPFDMNAAAPTSVIEPVGVDIAPSERSERAADLAVPAATRNIRHINSVRGKASLTMPVQCLAAASVAGITSSQLLRCRPRRCRKLRRKGADQ
jgi:hypothetical protein